MKKLFKKNNINFSEDNLNLIESSMPTLSRTPLGRVGAYTYYHIKEKEAKSKFNLQIIAIATLGLLLAGGFLFVNTVSYEWLQAWVVLGLLEASLIGLVTIGHKKYINQLDPNKLKYVSTLEIDEGMLKKIYFLAKNNLPATSLNLETIREIVLNDTKLNEDEIFFIESLKNEFEGSIADLISVSKNLTN